MLNQTEEQTCRLNGRWRGGDEGRVLHGNYSSQLKRLGWVDCCPFSFLSPAVLLWQFHTRAINVDRHISVWTLHRDPNWIKLQTESVGECTRTSGGWQKNTIKWSLLIRCKMTWCANMRGVDIHPPVYKKSSKAKVLLLQHSIGGE